jgi:hypothetical protein
MEGVRLSLIAAVLALAAVAAACGGERKPPRTEPRVRLSLAAPADNATVRSDTVELTGTVKPADARVEVLGEPVAVSAGRFRATVPLQPGANLIDVAATAAGRRSDFAAARIVREIRVAVPDVVGRDADTAQSQLESLGLRVTREKGGGFLDGILPGDPKVCDMTPPAGAQVLPGSAVTLVAARRC